jgi:hypothetical protein
LGKVGEFIPARQGPKHRVEHAMIDPMMHGGRGEATATRLSMVDEALVADVANTNGLLVIPRSSSPKGVFDRSDLRAFSDWLFKPPTMSACAKWTSTRCGTRWIHARRTDVTSANATRTT